MSRISAVAFVEPLAHLLRELIRGHAEEIPEEEDAPGVRGLLEARPIDRHRRRRQHPEDRHHQGQKGEHAEPDEWQQQARAKQLGKAHGQNQRADGDHDVRLGIGHQAELHLRLLQGLNRRKRDGCTTKDPYTDC